MQEGVISDTPKDIGHFLYSYNDLLDKKHIMEALYNDDEVSIQTLDEFVKSMNFKYYDFDLALRFVLSFE
jgi:Sec7-like guanine-nucleotide exchange factor